MPSEKELDKVLHEALAERAEFRSWFVSRLTRARSHTRLVMCRSNHPWTKVRLILPNQETGALEATEREGETDVLAVFEDASGHRVGVHIENKRSSGSFTLHQPEVYAARAEHWVGSADYGGYQEWETVLLAPEVFIARNEAAARKFTTRITYEQIATRLPQFGVSDRADG